MEVERLRVWEEHAGEARWAWRSLGGRGLMGYGREFFADEHWRLSKGEVDLLGGTAPPSQLDTN